MESPYCLCPSGFSMKIRRWGQEGKFGRDCRGQGIPTLYTPGRKTMTEKRGGYGQFCSVAMASEILCTRWTMLLLRELLAGSTRFNALRKGIPRMSPALLSKRLKELENSGVLTHTRSNDQGGGEYKLTSAGAELGLVVESIGRWGQRWVEGQLSLRNLDPSLLMWDMRRNLNLTPIPDRDWVIQFIYPELPASKQNWWLLIVDGEVDLCYTDPGLEIDLYVVTDLRTMTAIWMGVSTVESEVRENRLDLSGNPKLIKSMQKWLGLSPFATEERQFSA